MDLKCHCILAPKLRTSSNLPYRTLSTSSKSSPESLPKWSKCVLCDSFLSSNSQPNVQAIFMVGGFATSDYLFAKLEDHFKTKNINILRPDAYLWAKMLLHVNESNLLASGTKQSLRVPLYPDSIIPCPVGLLGIHTGLKCATLSTQILQTTLHGKTHVSKFPQERFGSNIASRLYYKRSTSRPYLLHTFWPSTGFRGFRGDGIQGILSPSPFRVWIPCSDKDFRRDQMLSKPQGKRTCLDRFRLMCVVPCWETKANTDEHLSIVNFTDLCEVTADMTELKGSIQPQTNHRGAKYYTVAYDIVLLFGLTELKAQIAWTQNVRHNFTPKVL